MIEDIFLFSGILESLGSPKEQTNPRHYTLNPKTLKERISTREGDIERSPYRNP